MPLTSYAVLTKSRAKYGKQLKEKDYLGLLACQSVPEVMVYLKSHTHFAGVLADVNERDVHRGRLEMLLRQNLFYEFDSLFRYDSNISSGFSRYVIENMEAEQIVRFLILLSSNSTEKFIFNFPAFFDKHTEIDIHKLAVAKNYEEFLEALRLSPYYRILKNFRPDEKNRLPVSVMETKIYEYIYGNLFDLIEKKAKGQEKQELMALFRTIMNYNVFSRIIRLKSCFDLTPEAVKASLMTQYCDIPPKIIDSMCKAESTAEVFAIMQRTGCGKMIDKLGYVHANDIAPRVTCRLAKKNMHFSNNPAVVMISYVLISEIELKNVISLIEGIRYKLDVKTIKSIMIF